MSAGSTRFSCHISAPRASVYQALIDPDDVVRWSVPDCMTSDPRSYEAREGGTFRIALRTCRAR